MSFSELFSYITSGITLIGFGITLWQIYGIKKRVQKAAASAREKIRSALTIGEVTETIGELTQIISDLHSKKIEIALYRMRGIRKVLFDIDMGEEYACVRRSNYKIFLNKYSLDIDLLHGLIDYPDDGIILRSTIATLEQLQENLILVKNYLNKKSYE